VKTCENPKRLFLANHWLQELIPVIVTEPEQNHCRTPEVSPTAHLLLKQIILGRPMSFLDRM
jgi:hypothetical protein